LGKTVCILNESINLKTTIKTDGVRATIMTDRMSVKYPGVIPGWVSRVTLDLAAQQNEDSGCYGKQSQDNTQSTQ
jgi:hypothetical protein